jgi:hypothetical protein
LWGGWAGLKLVENLLDPLANGLQRFLCSIVVLYNGKIKALMQDIQPGVEVDHVCCFQPEKHADLLRGTIP